MASKAEANASGIGFFGLLAVVFITLKLTEISVVATWSWWWVLAPLWMPVVIVLTIFLVGFLVVVFITK